MLPHTPRGRGESRTLVFRVQAGGPPTERHARTSPPFRLHGSRGPPCRRARREHTARLCWSDPLLLAAGGGLEPPSDDSKSSALPLRRTRITFARAGGVEPPRREIWNLAGYRSLARMARGPRSRARRIERRSSMKGQLPCVARSLCWGQPAHSGRVGGAGSPCEGARSAPTRASYGDRTRLTP